jgi:hypothetical protein
MLYIHSIGKKGEQNKTTVKQNIRKKFQIIFHLGVEEKDTIVNMLII